MAVTPGLRSAAGIKKGDSMTIQREKWAAWKELAKKELPKPSKENIKQIEESLLNQKIDDSFVSEIEITKGTPSGMRGQGKRSGRMVKGAMASIGITKEKRIIMNESSLNLSAKQKKELTEYKPSWSATASDRFDQFYLKARSKGYSHDNSLDIAIMVAD